MPLGTGVPAAGAEGHLPVAAVTQPRLWLTAVHAPPRYRLATAVVIELCRPLVLGQQGGGGVVVVVVVTGHVVVVRTGQALMSTAGDTGGISLTAGLLNARGDGRRECRVSRGAVM